jgi:AraC-like DNA-binding protein
MLYLPETVLRFVLLVGALHGVILGGILFYVRRNKMANRMLAILVILWSISAIARAYQGNQFYIDNPHFLKVFSVLALTWYPMLYLYVNYLIGACRKFQLTDLLHFLPLLIRIVIFIPFYSLSPEEKLTIYKAPTDFYIYSAHVFNYTVIAQGIIYVIIVLRSIKLYEIRIRDNFSNVDKIMLYWLRTLVLLGLTSFIFGVAATFAAGFYKFHAGILWDILYFILIFTIYLIGYKALRFSELFDYVSKMKEPLIDTDNKSMAAAAKINTEDIAKLKKYLEEEKPYLDHDLSLQSLASSLEMTRHQLSFLINSNYNKSFYDLIHEYRVKETLRMLNAPESKSYTIETIAYDAGFNSKATFNRVFKKVTGKTPSAYLRND